MARNERLPGEKEKLSYSRKTIRNPYPPIIEAITRLLVSILAGIFLLVPMISMSYINSKKYLLITASLFVLLFAVTLSLASKATNQELMVATATYAAVLVVFVGQTSVS
jgi:hypothetical protein